jgi:dTDP-4-amino-4,6-dideoxygalactose transaminase
MRTLRTDFTDVGPFIYVVRVLNGRRNELIEHLGRQNVEAGIHFVGVHTHRWFKDARQDDLAVTKRMIGEVVTLPLHSNMREDFVERVIEGVTSFFD